MIKPKWTHNKDYDLDGTEHIFHDDKHAFGRVWLVGDTWGHEPFGTYKKVYVAITPGGEKRCENLYDAKKHVEWVAARVQQVFNQQFPFQMKVNVRTVKDVGQL